MNNKIDITKLRLKLCSQCPFTCKGQLYCTRDNAVIEQDIKTFGSITELEKNNDTNRQS